MCQMCDDQARNDDSQPSYANANPCSACAGRGFDLDWVDSGGAMRAVPADVCTQCGGSGSTQKDSAP